MSFASSSSSSAPVLNPGAQGMYQNLLNLNQQNYAGILNSYNQGQANLTGNLQSLYSGYGQLENSVMNTLGMGTNGGWGVAKPAADAIAGAYSQARGKNVQNMINSGLGNSTLLGQMQNQAASMAGQSYGQLGSQLAQTAAGYQTQINSARLQAQMQGLGMQTQLQQGLGNALAGYKFANTFGDMYGQQSNSSSQQSSGGGGGGGGGGGSSGNSGMLGWGGLGATALGWMNGNSPGMGYTGAFQGGAYGGAYNPYQGGGGGFDNGMLYDYNQGGNYGGAFMGDLGDYQGLDFGDSGGGGDF